MALSTPERAARRDTEDGGPTPADFTYASRKGSLVAEEVNRLVGEFTSALGHKRAGVLLVRRLMSLFVVRHGTVCCVFT